MIKRQRRYSHDPKLKIKLEREYQAEIKEGFGGVLYLQESLREKLGTVAAHNPGMYITTIRSVLTYGALVCWKALDKNCNQSKVWKVQRLACLGLSGIYFWTQKVKYPSREEALVNGKANRSGAVLAETAS